MKWSFLNQKLSFLRYVLICYSYFLTFYYIIPLLQSYHPFLSLTTWSLPLITQCCCWPFINFHHYCTGKSEDMKLNQSICMYRPRSWTFWTLVCIFGSEYLIFILFFKLKICESTPLEIQTINHYWFALTLTFFSLSRVDWYPIWLILSS